MASETIDLVTETTAKAILEEEKQRNAFLAVLANESMASAITDYATIQKLVQSGYASKVFSIGDQINVNWTDEVAGKTYEWPFDVVHFDDVTLEDGEVVPGMFLQAHYSNPFNFPFDAREAFYYAEEGLPAGTYYFTIGVTWGAVTKGNIYEFTLESDVATGSLLVFNASFYSTDPDGTTVEVYPDGANSGSDYYTQTATLALVDSSSGTNLGTLTSTASGNLNSLQCAALGYNRWSQSTIRQYLNSSAGIGKWWTSQNNFDRITNTYIAYPGFMSGFEDDFLNILKPVKVTTALNTIMDSDIGTQEDTYDTFFLASLEQQFITPQLSGVEGDAWTYWKRATGSTSTITRQVDGAFPLTYAINAKTAAQNVRLRSAYRSNAYNVWYVTASGNVGGNVASSAFRFAPACVIC